MSPYGGNKLVSVGWCSSNEDGGWDDVIYKCFGNSKKNRVFLFFTFSDFM